MKIQCDNCNKKEASVFCSADEAALCDVCDQRVHHANKLASKHQRFSLLQSSPSHFPLCDICQEKRALVFCQQDRAILCRDCDLPLHTTNEHTQKHNRLLLTGIKLSHQIISNNNSTNNNNNNNNNTISNKKDVVAVISNTNEVDLVPNFNFSNKPTTNCSNENIPNLATSTTTTTLITNNNDNDNDYNTISSTNNQPISGGSTSKISDYLIDMLPGWRFEDLLLDSSASSLPPLGFYKSGNNNNNNHDYGVKEDNVSSMSIYEVKNNEKDQDQDHQLTSSPYSSIDFENCWVPQQAARSPIIGGGGGDISNVVFGHHHHKLSSTYQNYTSGGSFHGTKQHQQQQETTVNYNNINYNNNNNNNNNVMKFNRKCLNDDEDFFTVPQITSSAVGSKRSRSLW